MDQSVFSVCWCQSICTVICRSTISQQVFPDTHFKLGQRGTPGQWNFILQITPRSNWTQPDHISWMAVKSASHDTTMAPIIYKEILLVNISCKTQATFLPIYSPYHVTLDTISVHSLLSWDRYRKILQCQMWILQCHMTVGAESMKQILH